MAVISEAAGDLPTTGQIDEHKVVLGAPFEDLNEEAIERVVPEGEGILLHSGYELRGYSATD